MFSPELGTRKKTKIPDVIPEKMSAIRKMLIDDNHCTYQVIQKDLNIVSAAIHKIIYEKISLLFGFPVI